MPILTGRATLSPRLKETLMRLVLTALLLITVLPVTAEIYQYIDAQGNRAYSDRPPLDAQADNIKLPSINSIAAPDHSTNSATSHPDLSSTARSSAVYSTLQLTGLPDNQALRANNGSFSLQIEIAPKLASQHRLQLLINDQAYGASTRSTDINVRNLDRGQHRLAVQVLANSQEVQRSAEQTITIQRVHLGSPALRPKPTPTPKPTPSPAP